MPGEPFKPPIQAVLQLTHGPVESSTGSCRIRRILVDSAVLQHYELWLLPCMSPDEKPYIICSLVHIFCLYINNEHDILMNH